MTAAIIGRHATTDNSLRSQEQRRGDSAIDLFREPRWIALNSYLHETICYTRTCPKQRGLLAELRPHIRKPPRIVDCEGGYGWMVYFFANPGDPTAYIIATREGWTVSGMEPAIEFGFDEWDDEANGRDDEMKLGLLRHMRKRWAGNHVMKKDEDKNCVYLGQVRPGSQPGTIPVVYANKAYFSLADFNRSNYRTNRPPPNTCRVEVRHHGPDAVRRLLRKYGATDAIRRRYAAGRRRTLPVRPVDLIDLDLESFRHDALVLEYIDFAALGRHHRRRYPDEVFQGTDYQLGVRLFNLFGSSPSHHGVSMQSFYRNYVRKHGRGSYIKRLELPSGLARAKLKPHLAVVNPTNCKVSPPNPLLLQPNTALSVNVC